MKKTSFFFILIFSVFFSYKIAFAQVYYGTDKNTSWINVTDAGGGLENLNSNTFTGGCTNGNKRTYAWRSGAWEYIANTAGGCSGSDFTTFGFLSFNSSGFSGIGYDGEWAIFYDVASSGDPSTATAYQSFSLSANHVLLDTGIIPPDTMGTYNESPYNGEVVSTSGTGDVLVAFDYYLDTEQDPDHDTAEWCMRLVRNDGAGNAEFCDDVAFDTYTEVSHTFTGLALDSQWDWSIIFTRPGFFIDEYSILHAGSNYFFAGRFTIDSTVEEIYTAYTTCSITDLAGCFQNAIVFLFYPSQSSLNDFSNLYDAIKNKPPFGYISAVQTALQGINDTETSAFTLETMPILDTYIFTPVRTALIWIMWLAFIFMFYHRLKNIHL